MCACDFLVQELRATVTGEMKLKICPDSRPRRPRVRNQDSKLVLVEICLINMQRNEVRAKWQLENWRADRAQVNKRTMISGTLRPAYKISCRSCKRKLN